MGRDGWTGRGDHSHEVLCLCLVSGLVAGAVLASLAAPVVTGTATESQALPVGDGMESPGRPSTGGPLPERQFGRGDARRIAATPSVTPFVAPAGASVNLTSSTAIETARARGRLTQREVVASGDTLVLRVSASGLTETVAAREGRSATDRFRALVREGAASLVARQTVSSTSTGQLRKRIALLDPTSTVVVPGGEDVYYLVVDTGAVTVTRDADPSRLQPGDAFEVRFGFGGVNATTRVTVTDRQADFRADVRGGSLFRSAAPNRTFEGISTLAPGSTLRLYFSEAATGDRVAVSTTTVAPDGGFSVSVDLSGVANGTTLSVSAVGPGEDIDGDLRRVRVVPARSTLRVTDVDPFGGDVSVRVTGRLSRGGYLVTRAGGPDGPILDVSDLQRAGRFAVTLRFRPSAVDRPPWSLARLVVQPYLDAERDGAFDPATDGLYPSIETRDRDPVDVEPNESDGGGGTAVTTTVTTGPETPTPPPSTTPLPTGVQSTSPPTDAPSTSLPTDAPSTTPPDVPSTAVDTGTTGDEDTGPPTTGGSTTESGGADGVGASDGGGLSGFGVPVALVALLTAFALSGQRGNS